LLCLADTSLYIYICVKHFGMANISILPLTSKMPCTSLPFDLNTGKYTVSSKTHNYSISSSILCLPLLRPCTFLSAFFSKIRSPRSSLKVRDQITHPHITGKIILLHISVPVLLDCKWEEKDPGSKGGEHFPDLISSLFLQACNFSFVSVLPK